MSIDARDDGDADRHLPTSIGMCTSSARDAVLQVAFWPNWDRFHSSLPPLISGGLDRPIASFMGPAQAGRVQDQRRAADKH